MFTVAGQDTLFHPSPAICAACVISIVPRELRESFLDREPSERQTAVCLRRKAQGHVEASSNILINF